MKKNIFVIGPDELNWSKLRTLKNAASYRFHELLAYEESHGAAEYDVRAMLQKAEAKLDAFPGSIDAIVSFWDFPVSLMVALLGRKYGTVCAPLESVFRCEHKYWSRVEQRRAVPELIPKFVRFDPFDERALEKIDLPFPFWIKPIKSFAAHLGFRIDSAESFHQSVTVIRRNIGRFAEPFDYLLQFAEVPPEIREGGFCLAEQIIGGKQCTLEGFVCDGEVDSHGIVDSYRHPNRISFSRFEYPSTLPRQVQDRIFEASCEVMTHIGFDNSAFNIEYFYDRRQDRLWLLEINPRIAQSHSDLFKKVDGASNHRIMVQVGLGQHPRWPHREGAFGVAAKLFIREFADGRVTRIPGAEQIEEVMRRFPGSIVQPLVRRGMRLSELPYQDSYSFKLAILYMGAANHKELLRNFKKAVEILGYQVTR
jgi:biotin carboxylase